MADYDKRRNVRPRSDREERHLFDYLRVIYKRRWIAIPAFLLVFVPSAVNTFRATPVYEARAQLLIEQDSPAVASLNELFRQRDGWYEDDFYQTQYRLLQSRTVARRTVSTMRLWEHPAFAAREPERFSFSVGGAIGAVRGLVSRAVGSSGEKTSDAKERATETDQETAVLDAFLGGLQVVPVRNSRLVEVRFRSRDPKLAAAMANAHAQAFIDQNLELKFSASKQANDWLSQRVAEQRRKVEESEAALQAYKEQNDAVAVDDRQNVVVQKFSELSAALTRAKTERIDKEALYNQLKAAEGTAAIESFPQVLANDYIQKLKVELGDLQRQYAQLSQRYLADHPQMQNLRSAITSVEAKIRVEQSKVVESVRNDFVTAQAREQSLAQAVAQQKAETLSLNRKSMEYSVLQREAESNRQLYENLLQRTKETGLSGELRASNSRIVDPAETPRAPILPARSRDLMVGAFGGLLLAIGLVMGFEYMDNRLKTPHDMKTHLGLPFLGMVPLSSRKSGPILTNSSAPGDLSEAMKHVRTSLIFSSAQHGTRSILVTSAGPGEGKSMISSNLAITLAETGQRVLLVDADMRRPRVHENFKVPQEPGLSNLLVGGAKPSDALRTSSDAPANLLILPAGHIPPNPVELVGSQRFREYLRALSREIDWVVIDSPPILVVTDAAVMAQFVSGVVLVVAADQTSRHAAREAAEQLQSVNGKIIGTILNRVDLHRHPYYYSQYSRRHYSKYYVRREVEGLSAGGDTARAAALPGTIPGAGATGGSASGATAARSSGLGLWSGNGSAAGGSATAPDNARQPAAAPSSSSPAAAPQSSVAPAPSRPPDRRSTLNL
ncbi:MAG: GumC family protein [Vicinamibacterales bacterium]